MVSADPGSYSVVAPPGQARRKHDVCRRMPLKWSPRILVATQLLPRRDKPDGSMTFAGESR
jgi:hypothetical protein